MAQLFGSSSMPANLPTSHATSEIFQHLVEGDERACRELLDRLYRDEGASVLTLCEELTAAFHEIGRAWECSELEVYREHIASQIGYRLLINLRFFLSLPMENAPKAIGCTPECDPYSLPTSMIELVLRESGYNAQSLGTNLPLEMLAPAMDEVKPQLCWVSVSFVDSTDRLREQLSRLSEIGRLRGTQIVCGGRALEDDVTRGLRGITFLASLRELKEYVVHSHVKAEEQS